MEMEEADLKRQLDAANSLIRTYREEWKGLKRQTVELREMNSCFTCKHRHSHKKTESWELPHIFWWEHACDARPGIANLKQFPFNKTECKEWKPNDRSTRS